jgi:flagellin-like hook-associated protein FlgL
MPITIGANIASLRAQRQLEQGSNALSKVFERLSSGQRINRASDDAAGLSVSTTLNADARILSAALRNVGDATSLITIADQAINQLIGINLRQKELAEQAANGTYSIAQRRAMDIEANALVSEFNRIIESTEFNGITLLDQSQSTLTIQAGIGSSNALTFNIGSALARTVGTGDFGAQINLATPSPRPYQVKVADLDGDGSLDVVSSDEGGTVGLGIFLGNGNGTFKAPLSYASSASNTSDIVIGDVNSDGILDIATNEGPSDRVSIYIGNGNGTFKSPVAYTDGQESVSLVSGDFNRDGRIDLASLSNTDGVISVFAGNGNGTFKARVSFAASASAFSADLASADLNNDNILDLVAANSATGNFSVLLGVGDGTFMTQTNVNGGTNLRQFAAVDVNRDGIPDLVSADITQQALSVLLGVGDGTFKARQSYAAGIDVFGLETGDLNGDGIVDVVTTAYASSAALVYIGNGDGSFKSRASFASGARLTGAAVGDFNSDGVPDLVTPSYQGGTNMINIHIATTTPTSRMAYLNLLSASSSALSLDSLETTAQRLRSESGNMGAALSRLESATKVIQVVRENYLAAAALITNADIASDSAELIRRNILQQASTAILAQANQQPSIALQLLKRGGS